MVGPDVLLSMSRAELVARASSLGIERADRLTRPELRDEILRRTKTGGEADVARGFFGVARSMIASMMETGLKMPEAAALIRGTQTLSAHVSAGPPVATVTLAEIYAAQGHPDRALAMVERVLESEPDHLEAQRLRERLRREQAFQEPGLALRGELEKQVLETTGEEIRTGEPPPVQTASTPVAAAEALPEAEPEAEPDAAQGAAVPVEPAEELSEAEAAAEPEPVVPEVKPAPSAREVPVTEMIPVVEPAPASLEVAPLEEVPEQREPALQAVSAEPEVQPFVSGCAEIRLSVSGSNLVVEWSWPRGEQGALTATIVLFAFHGRAGRPNAEQARIPLELRAPDAPSSGSLHLAGFAGAAVSASIGLVEDGVFVPREQALLHRDKWRSPPEPGLSQQA